jgi:hypothetical protein
MALSSSPTSSVSSSAQSYSSSTSYPPTPSPSTPVFTIPVNVSAATQSNGRKENVSVTQAQDARFHDIRTRGYCMVFKVHK